MSFFEDELIKGIEYHHKMLDAHYEVLDDYYESNDMNYIKKSETTNTLNETAKRSGIPRHLLASKLVRLGIGQNGYISMDNQEYMQSVTIVKNNQSYHLVPSKMNFDAI